MPPVYCRDKKSDRTKAENEVCADFEDKRFYKGEYIRKPIYDDLEFIRRLKEAKQHQLEKDLQIQRQTYTDGEDVDKAELQAEKDKYKNENQDWTIPGYDFLGPGTDLDKKRFHVPRSKLNALAKEHDLEYEKPHSEVDTRTADKKFINGAIRSGELLGIPAAIAIETKHHLGLDGYFRPETTIEPRAEIPAAGHNHPNLFDSGIHMSSEGGDSATSIQVGSGGGGISDVSGMVVGAPRPVATGLPTVTTTFTRNLKNAVKGTNMNKSIINLTRTKQHNLKLRPKSGDWTKSKKIRLANLPTITMAEGIGESEDYILTYHMLGWIQNTQQEVLFANATHYKIESIGFRLYDLNFANGLR